MSWICPSCGLNNVNANSRCADYRCKRERSVDIIKPDDFDKLSQKIEYHFLFGEIEMTPNEEKFAKLFNGYKNDPKVNAMTDLELRAHREELSDIAFSAKAYIYAVDDVLKERKPKGPQGFARSVNVDDNATEAINNIKERQKRMTKMEKIQAGLEKLGISTADASKLMSAGTILGRVKAAASSNGEASQPQTPPKPLINPFEKK